MTDNLFIYRDSRAVIADGNQPASLAMQLGSTFDIAFGFMDAAGNVIALPAGSSGRMIIKPEKVFTTGPRFQMNAWTVAGSGSQRRYHFKAKLDSALLRADLGNNAGGTYEIQIEYTISGDVFSSKPIPVTVSNGYFQLSDSPPELPLGGPEAIEFHAEILPPGIALTAGTHTAGYVNRGGDLFNVRLSVDTFHAGAHVQVYINGLTALFTEPVAIAAATNVWTQGDMVNKLAVTSLPAGAKLTAELTFTGGEEYPAAPVGLWLDIALRTVAQIEQEGWEWLKARAPEVTGLLAHNDGTKELTFTAPTLGVAFTVESGFLVCTIGGVTYDITAFPRA